MRIVIVGDKETNIAKAGVLAAEKGAAVRTFTSFSLALSDLCEGHGADVMLVDAQSHIGDAIARLADARIHLPVIAYGHQCSARDAAAAIRAGAKDFIPLPSDPELISAVLGAITRLDRELVFQDPRMAEVVQLAGQYAPADATVLITGESGTGKEVMARLVHRQSRRAERSFISVNCAAIPENLLESELFGHEKGAFTGATNRRIGKFEEANNGTLLLDEISEMDVRLQAKLLRAIQEREIDRVGGTKPISIDIRLIATSNRDLEQAVRDGQFREDLLFRINVLALELPPLRERPQDIQLLSETFIQKYRRANQLPERRLSSAARTALAAHRWSGNVRELDNCLHRAVLLAVDGDIRPEHLRLQRSSAASTSNSVQTTNGLIGRTVADVERDLILGTLESTSGNRTRAAEILGISIRTLRNKLQLYRPEFAQADA